MTTRRPEDQPASVPAGATRAGEPQAARWAWVEPSVWTARMLSTLERGVKGGRWYALMDKVFAPDNLRSAWARVRANAGAAGVDHQSVSGFEQDAAFHLAEVGASLAAGRYRPQAVRRVHIPKPGRPGETRPLGIPTVRDRVVQTALRNVLEPIFEAEFAEHSYGFRPGRGPKDALRQVRKLIDEGHDYVVDADLKSYFDTIPHDALLERLQSRVTDGSVLALVKAFLEADVTEGATNWTPEEGTPQGGVISPLLANIYLDPLDHLAVARGWQMVRYADDFVVLCRTAQEAEAALAEVQAWTAKAGLRLHPDKTRLVHLDHVGSFTFLGYTFWKEGHGVGKKAKQRFRDRVRELTPRTAGISPKVVVLRLNRVLVGWFGYYKHCRPWVLKELDAFIRSRVRAILWRQAKGRGFPPRTVNMTWPTRYFQQLGLFSLLAAHVAERTARHAGRPPTGEPCA